MHPIKRPLLPPILSYLLLLLSIFPFISSCNKKNNIDDLINKYSIEKKDSLKLECLKFLKENIQDITSERLFFLNQNGGKENVRLDTISTYSSLRRVLEDNKIDFAVETLKDRDFLSNELIEENLNKAILDWQRYPWSNKIPKDVFLNYLLPYKVLNENPDHWRKKIYEKYKDTICYYKQKSLTDPKLLYSSLRKDAWSWLEYTDKYIKMTRYPSSAELLAIKKGECFELSHLFVYIARAAGIPSTIDIVPMWGKTNGSHASEVFYGQIGENKTRKEYGFRSWDSFKEPSKVFRISFKRTNLLQDSIIPLIRREKHFIPNFLKSNHLLDVTNEHTSTIDIVYTFQSPMKSSLAYICVYSYGEWKPIFYGKTFVNGKYVKFNNMGKDIIYHIAIPDGNSYKLTDSPFLLDSLGRKIYSKPNFRTKQDIIVKKINSGKQSLIKKNQLYTLKYLNENNVWKEIETKFSKKDSTLSFNNVPTGAFLKLDEKNAKIQLSRIFIYNLKKQIWY